MSPARERFPVVTLYGRAQCCLCDEARERLRSLANELGFTIRERDITADDRLHRVYLERIPVICVGAREVCELELDEPALRRALA